MAAAQPNGRSASLARLTKELLKSFRYEDEEAAFRVIERAIADGFDGPTICLEVLQPALDQVGRLWESGQVSIGEEHRATAIAEWLLKSLSFDFQPLTRRPEFHSLLATCVRNERHDLGLKMVRDFLYRDGWHIVSLGADTPESEVVLMAIKIAPSVCLLSAATLESLPALRGTISDLRGAGVAAPILVGGLVFRHDPGAAAGLGATAVARDAAEAVEQVHRLLGL